MNAEEKELLRAVFGEQDITFSFDMDEDEDEFLDEAEEPEKVDQFAAAKQIFEPDAIKEHFMEESDEKIRINDIPERLQLWHPEGFPRVAKDQTLEQEASWICRQYLRHLSDYKNHYDENRERYEERVKDVLELLLHKSFEVPFITQYRRDYWAGDSDGLKQNVLWKIMDWHDCWVKFVERRQALRQICESEEISSEVLDTNQVDEIHTAAELDDWFSYVSQQQPVDEGARRRPAAMRRRLVSECRKHEIHKFVERFGLSAATFGDNLDKGYQHHQPGCESLTPEALAEVFVVEDHAVFSKQEYVLSSAKRLLAQDIGTHPLVRKYVRAELEGMSEGAELYTLCIILSAVCSG